LGDFVIKLCKFPCKQVSGTIGVLDCFVPEDTLRVLFHLPGIYSKFDFFYLKEPLIRSRVRQFFYFDVLDDKP